MCLKIVPESFHFPLWAFPGVYQRQVIPDERKFDYSLPCPIKHPRLCVTDHATGCQALLNVLRRVAKILLNLESGAFPLSLLQRGPSYSSIILYMDGPWAVGEGAR